MKIFVMPESATISALPPYSAIKTFVIVIILFVIFTVS